jgi:preprotein translocase subunit SecY
MTSLRDARFNKAILQNSHVLIQPLRFWKEFLAMYYAVATTLSMILSIISYFFAGDIFSQTITNEPFYKVLPSYFVVYMLLITFVVVGTLLICWLSKPLVLGIYHLFDKFIEED